ncbi:ATP-binding protein [Tolypothrix sp. PCC 7910]|uniref:AAA family ATPase n=1 Tax=Tolypothrix sp. PCC 7910 TaxID=2099387 RepID=UPI0014279C2D|nr:ATP-binding protein [Tolypothrix sp. PCC 7910]QIR39301.1 ATP-binding protein [Tolypothrix sp. PCC 7910]
MKQQQPVPRLNLAPKLGRTLSIWNPLDYLRLLYWVFFFPQALRWYVSNFGTGDISDKNMTFPELLQLMRQNLIQRRLLIQGLLLTLFTTIGIALVFYTLHVPLNRTIMLQGMMSCLLLGAISGLMARRVAEIVAGGVVGGVIGSLAGGLAGNIILNFISVATSDVASEKISDFVSGATSATIIGLISGVLIGMILSVVFGVASGVASKVQSSIIYGVLISTGLAALFGATFMVQIGLNAVFNLALSKPRDVAQIIAFCIAFVVQSLTVLRIENWLIGTLLNIRNITNSSWLLSRITPIPLPYLSIRLQNWLQQDWETGLHNINQILAYTLQFTSVKNAVNRVLEQTSSEELIWRVSQLAQAPFDWKLIYYHWTLIKLEEYENELKLDNELSTPARAVTAGFWYLHEKQPEKAKQAFSKVRSLLYGEEMYILAETLAIFNKAKNLRTIANFKIPSFPLEPLLRSITWQALNNMHRVVLDVQFIEYSVSRSARSLALNRALGELTNILNQSETLPQAERGLVVDIAQNWKERLLQIAGEVGEVTITKPVVNPYTVGDPVQGNLFVGREDIIRQLEELWVMGHQLQSVVLYGHRRMGKTSILINAANSLGSGLQLIYVNLLRLGNTPQGIGEVLMAITDEISQAVKIAPPADADLLNLPYRTFERYFKQVEAQLEGGLIIALDEFEKIEELIEAGKIPQDFMGFLRGLVQMSSKVAFAFAGLHTLEEMTADYFQPFFASVIAIPVGFLKRAATRQILANPGEDFLLDYTPEALDEIYALTSGQPYLVQLLGFQLVRRYNDFVFEQGRSRHPVFTVEDVAAVINDSEFFKRGRYYFDGVWGQAMRGADGQQAIIQVLAPHPEGLSLDALAESTGMGREQLQAALGVLMRHDVVAENEGRWRIIVELFRRWVLQKHHG